MYPSSIKVTKTKPKGFSSTDFYITNINHRDKTATMKMESLEPITVSIKKLIPHLGRSQTLRTAKKLYITKI